MKRRLFLIPLIMLGLILSVSQRDGADNIASDSEVETAWVRHYASGLLPGNDVAVDVAVDDSGNVYVGGYTTNLPFGFDYFMAKYSSSGQQLWTARYNGEGRGEDFLTAMVVDSDQNVYVTGKSQGSGTSWDYATVKYNTDGVQQWAVRYDAGIVDGAVDMAVDVSGNIYVTGTTYSVDTQSDYTTIKYNSEGDEQWVAHYTGTHRSALDYARDLAVDASGNVYVTGKSRVSGSCDDYATVKYNSEGVEQWAVRYDGPGGGYDRATAVAVDDSGNVYVTGSGVLIGRYWGYVTIKYNAEGVEQWILRYDGPEDIQDYACDVAVDRLGNVYVTGYSYRYSPSLSDYTTIQYNAAGDEMWVAQFQGKPSYCDVPNELALDESGNVYVMGVGWDQVTCTDYTIVKYDSEGMEQWVAHYNTPGNNYDCVRALAVNNSGNVYVTGTIDDSETGSDFATVKFDAGGVQNWDVRYNGPFTAYDDAKALTIDATGSLYVTGRSKGSETRYDYATIKYNAMGFEEWLARYNGPENGDDEAVAVVVDETGNVYVTGRSANVRGFPYDYDYATVKLNAAGGQEWVARYNGPGGRNDEPTALTVDNSGNVYVTGSSQDTDTGIDYATVKYDRNGLQEWVARYNGPGNGDDGAVALVADNGGNVYVTGGSQGVDTTFDYATIKYNQWGEEQWIARYQGLGEGDDEASDVALDRSGNICVTGTSLGPDYRSDYLTVKYDRNGVQQWIASYSGHHNYSARASALAVDPMGNICVTGSSSGVGTAYDYATIKYSPDGAYLWDARYRSSQYGHDRAFDIAVDALGHVYVTGKSEGSGTESDFVTVKYDSHGIQRWVTRYNGPGNDVDVSRALTIDASGNVYVTGVSFGEGWMMYTTIKYTQSPIRGDVNADGRINILDVIAVVRHIIGIQPLENDALSRADCNSDGQISLPDVLGLVNVILGTGTCEPYSF